jgi:1-acyl-sn-glycerol-3-phosphate acyltransferase
VWLAGELLSTAIGLTFSSTFRRGVAPNLARARGMQRHARRLFRVVGGRVSVRGRVPTEGLLVSNHVSYLDILVLGSITPTVFVSKSEVRRWPVLGWLTHQAGTLFIQREKRSDVARINEETGRVLDSGVLLVIFPEGTSSDGREVLPFKSSLLEPIVGRRHALSAAHISYEVEDGNPAEDVCYWGEMTFGSHLLNLLTKRRIVASVAFTAIEESAGCRKELARHLHSEVSRLKSARVAAPVA